MLCLVFVSESNAGYRNCSAEHCTQEKGGQDQNDRKRKILLYSVGRPLSWDARTIGDVGAYGLYLRFHSASSATENSGFCRRMLL